MTRCNAGLLILAIAGWSGASGRLRQAARVARHARPRMPRRPVRPDSAAADRQSVRRGRLPATLLTAEDVLEKMAAAYKNAASYEDFGTLEFRQEPTQEQSETRANFSVTLQRPNKLRVEFFSGKVICDGKQWLRFCDTVPGQAVLRDAPPKLS